MTIPLFDHAPRPAWTGSTALVLLDRTVCPRCAGPLTTWCLAQQPLLRHGGYGAATETTSVGCLGCGWGLTVSETEVRPG